MPLVPFKKPGKPADYGAPSGPSSEGRMPNRMTESSPDFDSDPEPTPEPAPAVDGALRGHDTNYPNDASEPY